MMFQYCGYVLEVNPSKGDDSFLVGCCKELNYSIRKEGIDPITSAFKTYVDNEILINSNKHGYKYRGCLLKGERVYNLQGEFVHISGKCEEIEFSTTLQVLDYEKVISEFRKAVDNKIKEKDEKNKETTIKEYFDALDNIRLDTQMYLESKFHQMYDQYYAKTGFNFQDIKKHYFERAIPK